MTTVAFRGKVLAGDTRMSFDDGTVSSAQVRKVFRLRNGMLLGLAGTTAKAQSFLKEAKRHPEDILSLKHSETDALLVYPDGRVLRLETSGWVEAKADYYAIGSGSLAAEVAMFCGKSAIEAVKIAAKFDKSTGGPVQSVRLT